MYQKIVEDLTEIEFKIDFYNRKITKYETKQKMILIEIDDKFSFNFSQLLSSQCKEISGFISFFLGIKFANSYLQSVR